MLINTQVFPNEVVGLVADVIKYFRLVDVTKVNSLFISKCEQILQDEYIFKAGETAEGLFFILEGKVVILSQDEKTKGAYLAKNDVFGESAALDGKMSIRTVIKRIMLAYLHFFRRALELSLMFHLLRYL